MLALDWLQTALAVTKDAITTNATVSILIGVFIAGLPCL
jgi:hypothetical protein